MTSRTNTQNAWETSLSSTLPVGVLSVNFTSVAGITAPIYVVLDPEDPLLREYLKIGVGGISGNTVTFTQRNLEGSAGDKQHDPGAIVRLVWTKQLQDDIFNDIQTLEDADYLPSLSHSQAVHNNLDIDAALLEGSPKSAFVDKTGDTMSGELVLPIAPPSLDTVAANKKYVDDVTGGIIIPSEFPSGTRMIFDQASAPVDWTRDTTNVDDRMIRIVTGARDPDGGDWNQSSHTHTTSAGTDTEPDHQHSGGIHLHTMANHTHAIASTHSHSLPRTGPGDDTAFGLEGAGSSFEYSIKSHDHAMSNSSDPSSSGVTSLGGNDTQNNSFGNTSNDGGHAHGVNESDDGGGGDQWRPAYRDMIIAVKD
jgi:hypothetical protein